MDSFLSEVAARIFREHPNNTDKVAVVFNNRRPGLFLSRHLAEKSTKPIFLPKMMGMDDMVTLICGLKIVPSEFLLFELYDIHRQMDDTVHKYDSFEDFISFGELMLRDFSEVDLYKVDAAQLFSNLHELKAIDEWDVSDPHLTQFQKRYLLFYQSLYNYYTQLRGRLSAVGQAYSGMAYRKASELADAQTDIIPYEYVYFVGFNALSLSEQDIVSAFVRAGKGTLITDGDAYYFDDERQEAGSFLRRQAQKFPVPEGYPDHFAMQPKKITIVSCPENVLQTKYAAERLKDFVNQGKSDFDQTAVVLADEKLLVPMLNAIPEEIPSVNVTIGFPFSYSMVNALAIKLIELHSHRREERFYQADVISVITDRLFSSIVGSVYAPSRLMAALESSHAVYANWDTLSQSLAPLGVKVVDVSFAFDLTASTAEGMLNLWNQCIEKLCHNDNLKKNVKEMSALSCWKELTDYFQQLQEKYQCIDNLAVLQKLYGRLSKRHNVSFIGEPLAGLQLLGMLETRNLDFRRVILLSVNEGILPSGKSDNTLIPYSLKSHFGIPTYREKDAVYANHFYSLLQRAEEVDLVYSTDADAMGKGEPSRFLLQVKDELALRYPDIIVENKVVVAEHTTLAKAGLYEVQKKPTVMQKLMELAEKGFSPSALNLYRHCPLGYYYKYVLGVKEMEPFAEEADASELGTCIHDILEDIYGAKIGGVVSVQHLSESVSNVDGLVASWFNKQFGIDAVRTGRNHLSSEIAKSQLQRLLKSDIKYIESGKRIEILSVEYDMSQSLKIEVNDHVISVNIIGKADRIDRLNGSIRIADYKTGVVKASDVTMTDKKNDFPDKWFQVMHYAWLYCQQNHPQSPFQAGIIPLRSYNPDFMSVSWNGNHSIDNKTLKTFEDKLKDILTELLDSSIPFKPIENPKSTDCTYCPMKMLCELQRK